MKGTDKGYDAWLDTVGMVQPGLPGLDLMDAGVDGRLVPEGDQAIAQLSAALERMAVARTALNAAMHDVAVCAGRALAGVGRGAGEDVWDI